ncbi:MAG: carbon-nitrogen hydrolase family protein, partial [Proteocatella sp.]|nr:carbon-nitrogen hydrolase family protein [Proteocatella sp.]
MKLKIGLAQISVSHIKEDNLKKAENAIALLASDGADIVVLPEMFSCPYITSVFPEFAEPEGGHTWQRMSEAARRSSVILVAGS